MSAQNAKQDCRFLLRPFFVIFAAQGFGITGGTARDFPLAAGSPVRYHQCTCYEESLSAPNSCLSRQGRNFCTLSGAEGYSELRKKKS